MEFVKYNSLENSYRERFMSLIFDNKEYSGTWWATEKLHGTNFSFLVNGVDESVTPCKRSGPILESEKLYNYKVVYNKYLDTVKAIAKKLNTDIQIFGEMVGPSIFSSPNYGEQDFYVFDILVKNENGHEYLPFNEVIQVCNDFGMHHVPVLGVFDSKRSVREFHDAQQENDFKFETKLGSGLAEGFVIKPDLHYELPNGKRVIIKCKTSKFQENNPKKKREKPKLSSSGLQTVELFSEYLNQNRLESALSKIGNPEDPKIFSVLLKEIINDILEDISKDHENFDKSLGKEFSKVVSTFLKKEWLAKI